MCCPLLLKINHFGGKK
uniref:Uncharacterized protein n=1 Tax=Rhizophora mucronata TaxID=61149 RepID=A0A2P2Q462_RHIMU